MIRRMRGAIAAAIALGLTACAGSPRDPHVVLVVLDTVRADHLGSYGYSRATSPRLDAFARTATRFTRAFATSPWTLPTHASLFTGRHPFEHGARTFRLATRGNNINRLDESHTTLAEALRAEGYQTAAVIANRGFLAPAWGCNQGFDVYRVNRTPAARRNQRVFEWLDARGPAPFFLFVNYMDAHRPYNTAPRPGLLPRPVIRDTDLVGRLYEAVMPGKAPAPPELVQQVIDQYDTGIANLDEEVGRLFDRLQALRLYDDAVIVVTSDHGEYFGEHQLVEHAKEVYQEALHVPLLVKAPGQREGRVDETVVSSVDVPRLVLEHFPAPRRRRLESLFPYLPGNHPVIAELCDSLPKDRFHPVWGHRFDRTRTAIVDWPLKLIESSDGRHELYDLAADPREARSLRRPNPDAAGRLARLLAAFQEAHPAHPMPAGGTSLPPEEEEELRALGYIGG